MSQYFDNDESVKNADYIVKFRLNDINFSLKSNNGVFSKDKLDRGSEILIKTSLALLEDEKYLLDLGCGIGTIGLSLAKLLPNIKVVCSDVNKRALNLTRQNAHSLDLDARVKVIESNLFENITEIFDYILLNPPIRAGKKIIYEMYSKSYEHLKNGGSLLIVIRKSHGAISSYNYLKNIYKDVEMIDRDKGYHVYRAIK